MPFTPFHMGPALAIKAVAGPRFSVLSFGIAQVAMDIEPLVGMLRGTQVLHGASHTYWAALVIAAVVTVMAPAMGRPLLRRWNRELSHYGGDWLQTPPLRSTAAVAAGAFLGTLSHVALDSVMHADITPLAPWSYGNGLLGLVSIAALHGLCTALGVVGILAWWVQGLRRRAQPRSDCR